MTTFDKLRQKIKQELGYNLFKPERTYAGCNMKCRGAFTWWGWTSKFEMKRIGSTYPASELIKSKHYLTSDEAWDGVEIYPEEISR